jgi:hypothetical protein
MDTECYTTACFFGVCNHLKMGFCAVVKESMIESKFFRESYHFKFVLMFSVIRPKTFLWRKFIDVKKAALFKAPSTVLKLSHFIKDILIMIIILNICFIQLLISFRILLIIFIDFTF